MLSPRTAAVAAGLYLIVLAGSASAQIDYRNLDDERPVTTEDAYPVERHAFELLASYHFEHARSGERQHSVPFGIEYGVYDNTQIGLEAPLIGFDNGPGADTQWGLGGLRMFALYNFNTESARLPAVAFRTDVDLPTNSLVDAGTRVGLKIIATRSWGLQRLHLNAAWGFGPEEAAGAAEELPRWRYSLAADRTLFRRSMLLIGELAAARAVRDASVELNTSVGLRYQWSPTVVLDVGVSRRLRDVVGPDYGLTVGLSYVFGLGASRPRPGSAAPTTLRNQRDDWFYMPGSFNWKFLDAYPSAARLFNAFDYGHAVLYERLYTKQGQAHEELEKEYNFLTTDLLVKPPRFAVAEEAISPAYAKAAWRAKQMFDWAHVLHRQIFDVYADDRLSMAKKDSLIERLTDYYLNRREYAFASMPKSMTLMDGQYFSQTFREAYPKFNGLIWAYHWLQVGLYEPLIKGGNAAKRNAGIEEAIAHFWAMLEDPPNRMPAAMPMTAAIAPMFSQRHPRAAAIFDNLHMMHDIISDILTTDTIPHDRKREVIYAELDELQDTTRNVMTWDEWRQMARPASGMDHAHHR